MANAIHIIHYQELSTVHNKGKTSEYNLLVKKFPHAGWIPLRVSREPNKHGQEEDCIDHENIERIEEVPTRI
jgi:hypothetical protein